MRPEQEKELRDLAIDRMPDQFEPPFALWKRIAVKDVIRDRYRLELPIRRGGEYLKRWGFAAKKPVKRACEQNSKAVEMASGGLFCASGTGEERGG